MQKQAPSVGRILLMVVFAMSCFGLLLFLWLSFGGAVPLKPKSYRIEAVVPEATTLAQEADVRLSGVTIGRVKQKELVKQGQGTRVTIEIDTKYAPIAADSRLILRQKTLLGETYAEITPGDRRKGTIDDGEQLENASVEPTVELDEIFQAFDPETRKAFREWVGQSAQAIRGGTGRDLNEALGNLDEFLVDGADVLAVLDRQDRALRGTIRDTGVVFRALSEREGQLRQLIVNSGRTFDAFASRDEALAETFRIFPTFLDESQATLARLERFSASAQPVVRDLQPVADDLAPTIRDVSALAPDLRQLFRDLDPLIVASNRNTPSLRRFLRAASPVFDQLHPFFQELNPIVAFANYDANFLATFLNHGPAAFGGSLNPLPGTGRRHYLRAYGSINGRSLRIEPTRPAFDRGNSYLAPNSYTRGEIFGVVAESFDCAAAGGEKPNPTDNGSEESPPCFVMPPHLYDGGQFPTLEKGEDRFVPAPTGVEGTRPADPSR